MRYTPRAVGPSVMYGVCELDGAPAPFGFRVASVIHGLDVTYDLLTQARHEHERHEHGRHEQCSHVAVASAMTGWGACLVLRCVLHRAVLGLMCGVLASCPQEEYEAYCAEQAAAAAAAKARAAADLAAKAAAGAAALDDDAEDEESGGLRRCVSGGALLL